MENIANAQAGASLPIFPFLLSLPLPFPFPLPSAFCLHLKCTLCAYPICNHSFSPCVMHNGDCDWSPEGSGLISCGHWMMPMLWSVGRADKMSNKLAGDAACRSGSMVEHQLRLRHAGVPGSIPGWGVCDFFPFLPKLHVQFPFSFPFLFHSLSLSLQPSVCLRYIYIDGNLVQSLNTLSSG